MTDETFLAQHRATLVRDQDGWLLRYPIEDRFLYEEKRFNPPIEATILLVSETREDSLQIAELLLRDHKPPKILAEPATEQPTRLPSLPGDAVLLRRESLARVRAAAH
jgi:hypothetical protein